MEIEIIVKACINYEPTAQRYLYNYYAPTMKLLCNRYANSKDDAQDIMQEGFVKVFLFDSKIKNIKLFINIFL